MNTSTSTSALSSLRSLMVGATLIIAANISASAADASRNGPSIVVPDGPVRVTAAGPYVEVGTFRVQVSAKLGSPAAVLADGSWLYRGYRLGESSVRGTLLVRFDRNCVSDLQLIPNTTPASVKAKKNADVRVASRQD